MQVACRHMSEGPRMPIPDIVKSISMAPPEAPKPLTPPPDADGPVFGPEPAPPGYDSKAAEAAPAPEAEKIKELTDLQKREITTIGKTIIKDATREHDARNKLIQAGEVPPSDTAEEHIARKVLCSVDRLETIDALPPGMDKITLSDVKPLNVSHEGASVRVQSIDGIADSSFTCTVVTESGETKTVSLARQTIADAQLVSEEATIMAGIPQERRAAMQRYIDSKKPDQPELVDTTLEQVNDEIMEAAEALALPTRIDGRKLIESETKQDLMNIDKDLNEADADAKRAEITVKAQERINRFYERVGDAHILTPDVLAETIIDVSGMDVGRIQADIDAIPGQIDARQRSIDKNQHDINAVDGKDDYAKTIKAKLQEEIDAMKAQITDLRVKEEELKAQKGSLEKKPLADQIAKMTSPDTPVDLRAKLKIAVEEGQSGEQLLNEVYEIDTLKIRTDMVQGAEKDAALAQAKIKRDERHKKLAKAAKYGAAGIALALYLIAQQAGSGGGGH